MAKGSWTSLRLGESGEVGELEGLVEQVCQHVADHELVVQVERDLNGRYLKRIRVKDSDCLSHASCCIIIINVYGAREQFL